MSRQSVLGFQNKSSVEPIIAVVAGLFSVAIGYVSVTSAHYASLGLAAAVAVLALIWIPPKWLLWATIFLAPLDIYRADFAGINLSLYRVFLLAATLSWLMRTLPRLDELRVNHAFAGLFGVFALSSFAWFFTARYEIVGTSQLLNMLSGLLLILLFYLVLRSYADWYQTVRIYALSGIWAVLGFAYTYGLYFSSGQLVRDIPFREFVPFELASSGWLEHRHNVAGVPKQALPFSSPPHLAGFLAALLSILVVWFIYKPRLGHKRGWLGLYIALLLLVLLSTHARSGWLGFAGGLAIIIVEALRSKRRRVLQALMIMSVLLILMTAAIVLFAPENVIGSLAARLSSGSDTDLGGHLESRLGALKIWQTDLKTTLWGVGFSNYVLFSTGIHSHSPFTTILAERGLLGSVLFWPFYFGASLWLWLKAASLRTTDPERFSTIFGLFVATFAVLFGSLFYEYIFRNVIWILFALATAAMRTDYWREHSSLPEAL